MAYKIIPLVIVSFLSVGGVKFKIMENYGNQHLVFQSQSDSKLNQTFHIKITVPLRFKKIRKFLRLKMFNEIEIHSTSNKLKVMSNSRQMIQSTISFI